MRHNTHALAKCHLACVSQWGEFAFGILLCDLYIYRENILILAIMLLMMIIRALETIRIQNNI